MWSFDADAVIDDEFVAARIMASIERRRDLVPEGDAVRWAFSEADGLPGLVVDRYGDVVVFQITTAGMEAWRQVVTSTLASISGVSCVYERSDADARSREGLANRDGATSGRLPDEVWAHENGSRFRVDVASGHKTGFYVDQRLSRASFGKYVNGRRVLNVFGYTGSFSVIAARCGASEITTIDSSGPALALAAENGRANGVDIGHVVEADAFSELRRLRDRGEVFDVIVLDPPKLAHGSAQVDKASRAYKDLNLLAAKLLSPGGHLFTFSCSGAVNAGLFQKIVAGAALDARREMHIVERLSQPADHPVPLTFPEADYLTGLVLRAL
jgi:23S rRNA (cytosine1962-C5)-methyltransferase